MWRLGLLVMLGACAAEVETAWQENPCGRAGPVEVACEEADRVDVEPDAPLCSDLEAAAGDACDESGGLCILDPGYTCSSDPNADAGPLYLTCQAEPIDGSTCPISSKHAKKDIRYVGADQRRVLAKEILDVKLARYAYRDPAKPGQRLGYILEDQPNASFSGDGHVDLYAYTSAIVALAQEQQVELERLRAEVEQLKAERAAD